MFNKIDNQVQAAKLCEKLCQGTALLVIVVAYVPGAWSFHGHRTFLQIWNFFFNFDFNFHAVIHAYIFIFW